MHEIAALQRAMWKPCCELHACSVELYAHDNSCDAMEPHACMAIDVLQIVASMIISFIMIVYYYIVIS